jgi:hypothetical protein
MGSWKWDVTAYDRPGWSGRFRGRARVHRADGRRIAVRFEETERATYYGDQFMGRHRDTWLVSNDGGQAWARLAAGPVTEGVALRDGTRLVVDHTCATRRDEALRTYLQEQGVPQLWNEEAFAWWDVAALSRREALERQGLFVRESGPADGRFLAYLQDLSVGVLRPGETEWLWRPLEGMPRMAHLAGWWRQRGVLLPDGTVVGCVTGKVEPDELQNSAFALRSTDGGQSWELHPIARIRGALGFNETFMHVLADGQVLALIRTTAPDGRLYRSVSDDGGATWSEPAPLPVWGFPAHVIPVRGLEGARDDQGLLCAYAHRRHPYGVRAVLSRDGGETWDVAHEKVIRDDSAGVVGYPTSVQLDDDTIFTAYELGKPAGEGERAHSYVAGSRYSLDYVAPLGR